MNIKMITLALLASASLGIAAAPALAQTSGTTTYTPPATSTPTPCSTNCTPAPAPAPMGGYQTVNTIIGSAAFNGYVMGQFGAPGPNGTIVPGSNVTGKVDLAKYGSGDVKVTYHAASNFCQVDCTTQRFGVDAWAQEKGYSSVTAQSTVPGQAVMAVNSGVLNSGIQLRYGTTSVPTATPNP